MKQKPGVSEHALFRFLERSGRVDMEALKREILSPTVEAAIRAGARSVKANGMTFIIDRGQVVTVLNGSSSNKRPPTNGHEARP